MATAETVAPPAAPLGAARPAPAHPECWFWVNLVVLAVLAPFSTYWFKQHLELYLTEVLLIGGGVSVWAALRMAFGLAEKVGKLDPLSLSRRALGTPEATLLLLAAAVVLGLMWQTTNSLYLQYDGGAAGDREFIVQVNRASDGTPFMPDTTVGPAAKVAGKVFPFKGEAAELECRIVRPLLYEPLPCAIGAGEAKRVRVPGGFKPRTFHLLRIVPMPKLFAEIPKSGDQPDVSYRLDVTVDGKTYTIDDVRRQTIYAGGKAADMPLLLAQHDRQDYEQFLGSALRAMSVDDASAIRIAATLVVRTKTWDALDAKAGQQLSFSMKRIDKRGDKPASSDVEGFPFTYVVTPEKLQVIWLPIPPP